MTGLRFTRLLVLSRAPNRNGQAWWHCVCDCGVMLQVFGRSLRRGDSKSCGCLSRDRIIAQSTTHGQAKRGKPTTEYQIWQGMMKRCENPRCPTYRHYGGRGITVHPTLRTFEGFLAHLGPRPAGLTLERINNDSNYEPGNVCWATRKAQARNSRHNRLITINGATRPLVEWCEQNGLRPGTASMRLHYGWSERDAVTTPVGGRP